MENCRELFDVFKRELKNFSNGGTYFGLRKDQLEPYKRSHVEGDLADADVQKLYAMISSVETTRVEVIVAKWNREKSTQYTTNQLALPSHSNELFGSSFVDIVRPILDSMGETYNQAGSKVFIINKNDTAQSSFLLDKRHFVYFLQGQLFGDANGYDRMITSCVELGMCKKPYSRLLPYQTGNPRRLTMLAFHVGSGRLTLQGTIMIGACTLQHCVVFWCK